MSNRVSFRSPKFTRWVVFAILFFGIFGYATRSLFRLFRVEDRYTNVSYDSNLHDKSDNSGKQRINTIVQSDNVDIERISRDLGQADNLIKAGENKKSLTILENSKNIAFANAANSSDRLHTQFATIGNEIVNVEKNLKQGEKESAIEEIELLLKQIKARH